MNKYINTWAVVALIIIGYFTIIYKLNNKENIIRREPKSLFKFEEEQLQATITLVPPLENAPIYISNHNTLPPFSLSYPSDWSVVTNTTDSETMITIQPFNNASSACIKIYQTKDNMPLLEAVNYNKYMLQKKETPYFLKEAVETTVASQPAHISKLRLNNSKPEEYVQNAVIVADNVYTTIIRTCPGTPDSVFFGVLQTFQYK